MQAEALSYTTRCMSQEIYKKDLPLSRFTTFRIGGPAALLAEVSTETQIIEAVDYAISSGIAWRVLGHGSNILAADDGVDAAIIVFKSLKKPVVAENSQVTVSGGYPLAELVNYLASSGFRGLEKLAGIPGTVGGAIAGNAGAYGTSIAEHVRSVRLLGQNRQVREVHNAELNFGYRHSALKETREVVLEATIDLEVGDKRSLMSEVEARFADRQAKHPDYHLVPTAGSYFKNIRSSDGTMTAAGRLLEESGCKALRVGGARAWHRHANILVTDGNASAADVLELADQMSIRVKERCGVILEPEVSYIGK